MCSFKFIEKVKKIKESNPNIFSEEDNKYVSDWEKNEKYNKECPDIYAGYIKDGECTVWFGKQYRDDHKKDLDNTKEEEGMKNIVVILESPHTDEYKDSNFIDNISRKIYSRQLLLFLFEKHICLTKK